MFALVDCNNFYASCERVFNPKLDKKPIVILSNNDDYKNGELKSEGSSITEGIGQGRITKNLEKLEVDFPIQIDDVYALEVMFKLVEKEGLFLGGSSGINVAGALELAKEIGPGKNIVTILCDSGSRYQTKLYNRNFLINNNLPCPDWL